MTKKKFNYYSLKNIQRKNATYNVIFGERSNGKTYAVLKQALENYKKQLRLSLMLMLEDGEHIVEPGEETEDDIDWESICP